MWLYTRVHWNASARTAQYVFVARQLIRLESRNNERFMGYREKSFIKLCKPGFLMDEDQNCPTFFGRVSITTSKQNLWNHLCDYVENSIYGPVKSKLLWSNMNENWDSSLSIMTGYVPDGQDAIPGRVKKFFSSPQHQIWGPSSLRYNAFLPWA